MKANTKKIILIVGPTAIGKTTLSIKLAEILKTQIISCDSRQFYKELKIGSAAPSKKQQAQIKHHFIHNLSVTQDYNAGKFEFEAINLIKKLHKINNTIIVVGGSGLYIDAICKGFDEFPEITKETRKKVTLEYQKKGLEWLQKKVKKIEPEHYSNYELNNPQRLLRIVEIYEETGKKMSSLKSQTTKSRPFEIIKIGLNIERKILYDQINKRVDIMIEKGLLEEVISLKKLENKNALNTVGYKEIFAFLRNECTLEEAIKNIKKNTRRFAKRQLTWFRKDNSIKWFKPNQILEIQTYLKIVTVPKI